MTSLILSESTDCSDCPRKEMIEAMKGWLRNIPEVWLKLVFDDLVKKNLEGQQNLEEPGEIDNREIESNIPGATKDLEELKIQVPELSNPGFIELDSGELQNQDQELGEGAQEERNEDINLDQDLETCIMKVEETGTLLDNGGCDNYVSSSNPKTKRLKTTKPGIIHKKESRHIIKRLRKSKIGIKYQEEGPHLCDQCPYTSNTSKNLKIHKESRHEGVRFTCDQCGLELTSKGSLKLHTERYHEEKRYPCNQCELVLISANCLKVHEDVVHRGIRHACDKCDYVTTTATLLQSHIDVKHKGIRFSCDYDQCSSSYTTPKDLRRHKENVHLGVRYPCDQCEYKATTKGSLTLHIKSVHEGKLFLCDQCEHAAITSYKLNVHMKRKHDCFDTVIKGYGVPSSKDVVKRPRKKKSKIDNPDVGPHLCDQCPYTSNTLRLLKLHKESRHEGIRFPCDYDQCNSSYTTPKDLRRHKENVHLGVRYPCDQCEYNATMKGSLTIHKQSVHEGVRYPCDKCEFASLTPYKLKEHKKNKHE